MLIQETLPFVSSATLKTRSPEECKGSANISQSIDTYGMGTVFFYLLTLQRTYSFNANLPGPPEEYPDWYREHIIKGDQPKLPDAVELHKNPAIIAIKKAMRAAMTNDPRNRISASSTADFLERELSQYRNISIQQR